MQTAYKLTDTSYKTRASYPNCLTWGENVTHTVAGSNPDLCSDSWIHFYVHPFLASIMNIRHANIKQPVLWECLVDGQVKHELLKSGCKQLTTIRVVQMPEYSLTSKIAFAILIVKQICKNPQWNKWADDWLSGVDRSKNAAYAAADVAYYAAYYAAHAAYYADTATNAAAYAAYAADAINGPKTANIDILSLINQALQIPV